LTAGIGITVNESQPSASPLAAILAIVDVNGNPVATSGAGAASLSYTIPTGADGKYYVRVTAGSNAGVLAQYRVLLDLVDTVPPTIAADTLPAEASTTKGVVDRFTLTFSEDMAAATVNNVGNVDLRSPGLDGLFDTADDVIYHFSAPGYTA